VELWGEGKNKVNVRNSKTEIRRIRRTRPGGLEFLRPAYGNASSVDAAHKKGPLCIRGLWFTLSLEGPVLCLSVKYAASPRYLVAFKRLPPLSGDVR